MTSHDTTVPFFSARDLEHFADSTPIVHDTRMTMFGEQRQRFLTCTQTSSQASRQSFHIGVDITEIQTTAPRAFCVRRGCEKRPVPAAGIESVGAA